MNLKLLVGGVAVAMACFMSGALLSDRLPGSVMRTGRPDLDAADPAGREQVAALPSDASRKRARAESRNLALRDEIRRLRDELERKDEELAELRDEQRAAESGDGADGTEERSRQLRWERIQEMLSPLRDVMLEMDEDGANQLRLGPHLVAELGKVTPAQFAEIVAFDADETDVEILRPIRAFMMPALIYAPAAAPQRNAYMSRLLDRVYTGTYGDVFTEEALHRLSFSSPSLDMHKSLIEPLNDEVRSRFVDLAAHRLHVGPTEPLQVDGARFLARSTEPRATDELMTAFRKTSTEGWIRMAVLEGLAARAATDDRVLRFLRDAEPVEPQGKIRAALTAMLARLDAADSDRE